MNKEDLEKTLKLMKLYNWSTEDRTIDHNYKQEKIKGWYTIDDLYTDFETVVLENEDEVYQAGTDSNTIGVELKTFEDFKIRFESFTGEKLEND